MTGITALIKFKDGWLIVVDDPLLPPSSTRPLLTKMLTTREFGAVAQQLSDNYALASRPGHLST